MNNLANLTETLIKYLQKSEGFILEQAPDMVQQLLAYKTIFFTITTTLFGILMILGIIVFIIGLVKDWDFEPQGGIFVITMISCLFFSIQVFYLLKVKLAPKIYLLEYLKNLLQ